MQEKQEKLFTISCFPLFDDGTSGNCIVEGKGSARYIHTALDEALTLLPIAEDNDEIVRALDITVQIQNVIRE